MADAFSNSLFEDTLPSGVGSTLMVYLDRLQANATTVRQRIGKRFFWAVVKADGYGVGAIATARAFLAGGADGLAVARIEEYQALREAGFSVPVLLLGPLPDVLPDDVDLHVSVTTLVEASRVLSDDCEHPVHLKIDTGMGRLGIPVSSDWLDTAKSLGGRLYGMWSHYSHSDTPSFSENTRQVERMQTVLQTTAEAGVQPTQIHMANSGGLAQLQPWENAVRIGLYLYGVVPWCETVDVPDPELALEWVAAVKSPRTVPAGWGLSYRSLYRTSEPARVGVLPIGYADGLPATPAETVFVTDGTTLYPLRGRITMDLAVVELEDGVADGTLLYALGPGDSAQCRTVNMLAQTCGRIPYEVLTSIGPRVVRRYIGSTP